MDSYNSHNTGTLTKDDAVQSGHWFPALRPDDIDDGERVNAGETNHPAQALLTEPLVPVPPDGEIPASEFKEQLALDSDDHTPPTGTVAASIPLDHPDSQWPTHTDSGTQEEDEMFSDDDDERLYPSWGFKRMSTAQILGSVERSTTFPSFPTPPANEHAAFFDKADPSTAHPTLQTQLSNGESQPSLADRFLEQIAQADERTDLEGDAEEELGETPIGALSQDLEDGSDSRYEEGLPLVPPRSDAESPSRQSYPPAAYNALPSWADTEEDTSFFNNVAADAPDSNTAPELTRKTTSMVVDQLHVQLKPELPKNTTELSFLEDSPPIPVDTAKFPAMTEADAEAPPAGDVEDLWNAIADDDEFLVEDPDDLLPDSEPGSPSSFIASLQDDVPEVPPKSLVQQTPPPAPRPSANRLSSSNAYAPHQPSTSELAQLSPTTHGNLGLSRPGLEPMNSFQAHLQQKPATTRAESFVDQSKGGYKSPYDLPMELSKPRKRPAVPQLAQTNKPVPPPPRSSSISDKQLQSPFSPSAPDFPQAPPYTVQQPPAAPQQRSSTASVPPRSSTKPRPGSSSFFEELPITSKPRPGAGSGRFTPQQPQSMAPPQIQSRAPPTAQNITPQPQSSPPQLADPYAQFQLRPPERVDPFTNIPLQPPASQVPAALATRYSPVPPGNLTAPRTGPSPRYSPAPPSQQSGSPAANRYTSQPVVAPPPQVPQLSRTTSQPPLTQPNTLPSHAFQPRTSSPLAYHKKSIDASAADASLPPLKAGLHSQYSQASSASPPTSGGPPVSGYTSNFYSSPPKPSATDGVPAGPPRSQTQSPSKQRARPAVPLPTTDAFARPASAHGQLPSTRSYARTETFPPARPNFQQPGIAEELDFIQPTDETQFDPLQRWKGAPVFHFGFGGTLVSTFPKHIPRYGAGAVRPQYKAAPGDVTLRAVKDVVLIREHYASFPGPLRAKSRKKDLVSWIGNLVSSLEAEFSSVLPSQTLPDPRKRHQEKILLWKLLKSMVEHDGALGGNAEALKSVNLILAPEIYHLDEATATQYRDDVLSPSGTYRPSGAALKPDAVDPLAMQTLQKHLLRGSRQEAVWFAVDNRLWSHAMLIASTLTRDVWRQVVQEFVKREVRIAGENAQPLSAVYEIFGGNLVESIDQLVPPSARAGLQMVSKVEHGGPTKNALDGLDKWKDTLNLVINNRCPGDHGALLALGTLLLDYGRVEAAHICYLFARNQTTPNMFGGADDPLSNVVLLGTDHKKQPIEFARDQEAILLTETYEFATLVLTGSATTFMPYLSAYKLQRAFSLADAGFKTEAQSYCDALTATIKSTKAPAYYHSTFLGELEEFSNRLKQVPVQSSSSWMAKPSIEKVSGSVWNKFSSFVVGDDSDADSKGSGRDAAESGPFAKIAGTPSLSRHGSQSDIYGAQPTPAQIPVPSTSVGSRYAPNGIASTRSSSELTRGRPSLDSQRSPPTSSQGQIPRTSAYDPINILQRTQVSPPPNVYQNLSFGASPPTSHYQATPPQTSYFPTTVRDEPPGSMFPPRQESYIPTPPPEQSQTNSYEPKPIIESQTQPNSSYSPAFGGFVPPAQSQLDEPAIHQGAAQHDAPYEPPAQSYGYGYEPPADTGYTPYTPETDSPEEPRPKKKSFLGDDDDFPHVSNPEDLDPTPSAALKSTLTDDETTRRMANDAAADAAFRAAAEADAARAKEKQLKTKPSGWFGGWLGAKKSDSLDNAPTPPPSKGGDGKTVYKAKLGETKMKLYYDEKLKKWVNPDNPDAATNSARDTPPPPRAAPGPPRSVSAMGAFSSSPSMGPPLTSSPGLGSGPPSRAGTPASAGMPVGIASTLSPGVNASLAEGRTRAGQGLGVGGLTVPSGPPSRPSTSMSNASSIDDLLGAPSAGAGRKSVKGKKGGRGRYVDVMAK